MTDRALEGAELDAAVAKAMGYTHHGAVGTNHANPDKPWCLSDVNDWWKDPTGAWLCGPCHCFPYAYSSDWERAGPIIERERISLDPIVKDRWCATASGTDYVEFGPTPLIAAMRAFCASRGIGADGGSER